MRASVRSSAGAAFLILATGAGVNAQEPRGLDAGLAFTWNAPPPPACPERDDVLGEVARVLGETRQDRVPTTARADVAIAADGRWRADLVLDALGAHDERHLEAESCAAIASAAALIVAVSIEGGASPVAPPPETSVAPGSPPALPAAPPSTAVRQRADEPRSGRSAGAPETWHLVAAAAGLVDDGIMPNSPAVGFEAALGARRDVGTWDLRALGGLSLFPTESTAAGGGAGESGRFSLLAVSARLCAWKTRGQLAVGPCLGVELDRMRASGAGPAGTFQPGSADGVWGSALGAIVTSFNLSSSIAAFARAESVVPFMRTRFILTPIDVVVHEPSPFALRAALGLELRIF